MSKISSAVKLLNLLEDAINPATEEKQDTIITNSETLNSLIETIQELNARLLPLTAVVANTNQLRSVVTGTVTASGPQTSAQFIAAFLISKIALENMNAVHSNINNVVIT